MKTLNKVILIITLCGYTTFGDEDIPLPVKQIEFKFDDNNKAIVEKGYPPELAKSPILLHQHGKSKGKVVGLHLVWNDKKLSVPKEVLKDTQDIQLDSIEIRYGAYWGGVNDNAHYRMIRCYFGKPVTKNGDYMEAWFLFWGGKYQKLSITVPVTLRREAGAFGTTGFIVTRKAGEDGFLYGSDKFMSLSDFLKKKEIQEANKALESTSQ